MNLYFSVSSNPPLLFYYFLLLISIFLRFLNLIIVMHQNLILEMFKLQLHEIINCIHFQVFFLSHLFISINHHFEVIIHQFNLWFYLMLKPIFKCFLVFQKNLNLNHFIHYCFILNHFNLAKNYFNYLISELISLNFSRYFMIIIYLFIILIRFNHPFSL